MALSLQSADRFWRMMVNKTQVGSLSIVMETSSIKTQRIRKLSALNLPVAC